MIKKTKKKILKKKKKKNTVIDIFTLIEEKQIRGNIVKKIFHAIFCLIS